MRVRDTIRKNRRIIFGVVALAAVMVVLPSLFVVYARFAEDEEPSFEQAFPVTVDPKTKTILEDQNVEAYLQSDASPLQASVIVAISQIADLLSSLMAAFSNFAADRGLALASGDRIVQIPAGARKEEIGSLFAKTFGWDTAQKQAFLTANEGYLFPDTYVVPKDITPLEMQAVIEERFRDNVVARYGSTTEAIVPLETALTIASLIQKETIGTRDMRLVSGIIWNRIFADQKLQLDATLQYAKATKAQRAPWWPRVLPNDKFIKSPFNTYQNEGLTPTPIDNPSVAAVIAALNPVKTDCYYYFHDKYGDIHCSPDYKTHVAQLKASFGRGK